jgi:hypothetical protein
MLRDKVPVRVQGEGYVEIFAWETEPGFAIHILNYNNPNMTKASIRQTFPIGHQKVTVVLPQNTAISKAALLRSAKELKFTQTGNTVEFEIPSIQDFEVAVLYRR